VIPAKTAEPIEMWFGMLSRVSPENCVLHGVQMLPRKGALLDECLAHYKAQDFWGLGKRVSRGKNERIDLNDLQELPFWGRDDCIIAPCVKIFSGVNF